MPRVHATSLIRRPMADRKSHVALRFALSFSYACERLRHLLIDKMADNRLDHGKNIF
jgi:hypothetical protein